MQMKWDVSLTTWTHGYEFSFLVLNLDASPNNEIPEKFAYIPLDKMIGLK